MRTIGRHRPSSSPRGDFQSKCDYCGGVYYRSELRRDGSGKLMCENDEGIDAKTLDEMNLAMTPPHDPVTQDASTEAKVTETPTPLRPKIGGWTFGTGT